MRRLFVSVFGLLLWLPVLWLLVATPAMADFAAGKKAYDTAQWEEAILNLRPAAEVENDPRAMVLLGNMYVDGFGVIRDPAEAFLLYRRAARLGLPEAMVLLGGMYQQGLSVAANLPRALLWYDRAARAGAQNGAFLLAGHLYQGYKSESADIKPDHPVAYQWFLVAARGGNPAIAKAANEAASAMADTLDPQARAAAEAFAAGFKPLKPEDLGPSPE